MLLRITFSCLCKDQIGAEVENKQCALTNKGKYTSDIKSLKSGRDFLEKPTADKDTLHAGDGQ
jgi:hypothetical protein